MFSTDVISDDLINLALNLANQEVQRAQKWPASISFTYMEQDTDAPGVGWDQFQNILVYRVALQVLQYESDDSNRSEWFTTEYNKALQEMAAYFLPALATGSSSTTTNLIRYVRDLTGQYGIDLSDALIQAWLNEAYQELYRSQNWASSSATPAWTAAELLQNNVAPAFLGTLHPLLAYRVAAKIMSGMDGQEKRAALFLAEYQSMVSDLVEHYFPSRATGAPVTLQQIIKYVRDLTSVYGDTYSEALIGSWVNEAYSELAAARDWQWLEVTSVTSTYEGQTQLSLGGGVRRVLEVWVLQGDRDAEEMIPAPQVVTLTDSEPMYHYDVSLSGVITWQPSLREAGQLHVRYLLNSVQLNGLDAVPAFEVRFVPILAYRVAAKIAAMQGDKQKTEVFTGEYNSLFDQMVSEYTLSHDNRPFQLGSQGLETRKYLPWFRTV